MLTSVSTRSGFIENFITTASRRSIPGLKLVEMTGSDLCCGSADARLHRRSQPALHLVEVPDRAYST